MRTADQVAIAALANLVRLLCAELVAGMHRDDVNMIENAVRSKLNIAVSDVTPEILAEGLKRAHEVLSPMLANVRAQAAAAQDLAGDQAPADRELQAKRARFLN